MTVLETTRFPWSVSSFRAASCDCLCFGTGFICVVIHSWCQFWSWLCLYCCVSDSVSVVSREAGRWLGLYCCVSDSVSVFSGWPDAGGDGWAGAAASFFPLRPFRLHL